MARLQKLGSNVTGVHKDNGTFILFSYNTPVAAIVDGVKYKTSTKHSVTTSKHINQHGFKVAEEKQQYWFEELL